MKRVLKNAGKTVAFVIAVMMFLIMIRVSAVYADQKYKTIEEDGKQYIVFGSYEQDGYKENGKEPIEWEILGEDDKGILVVSRYILDYKPYGYSDSSAWGLTWKTSTLRKWLNKKFFNKAFNAEEQKMINTVKVKNSDDPVYGTEGGKDTKDKIFILSLDEILKYYSFNKYYEKSYSGHCQALIVRATAYTEGNYDSYHIQNYNITESLYNDYYAGFGYTTDCIECGGGFWWLRTRSDGDIWDDPVCFVDFAGDAGASICYGAKYDLGVRPALYLKKADLQKVEKSEIIGSGNSGSTESNGTGAEALTDEERQAILTALSENYTIQGDNVIFGTYEQDNDTKNGSEPIEWEVLGEDENGILLVSKYILDCQRYYIDNDDVTWETCRLRRWLNDTFYTTAFSAAEQAKINTTTIVNADNQYYGTEGGNDTQDSIFCLSVDEIMNLYSFNRYFHEVNCGFCQALIVPPTTYATNKGVSYEIIKKRSYDNNAYTKEGIVSGRWWLRSPGNDSGRACFVGNAGDAGAGKYTYVDLDLGVRPALYIKK